MTDPFANLCTATHATFDGWSGQYPRCGLPAGHIGSHKTLYGLKFDDKGETIK